MDNAQSNGRTARVWTWTVASCCDREVFVRMDYLEERGELRVPHCGQTWTLRLDPSKGGCGEWPWNEWIPCETAQAVWT